jgi:hypothetical protein
MGEEIIEGWRLLEDSGAERITLMQAIGAIALNGFSFVRIEACILD